MSKPQLLAINNAGTGGLNTDIPPWKLSGEFINGGRNFRIAEGAVTNHGGHDLWVEGDADSELLHMLAMGTSRRDIYVLAGRNGLFSFNGSTITRLCTFTRVVDPDGWSSCMLGAIPIFNHPEVGPWYWYPYTGPAHPLPFMKNPLRGWDASIVNKSGKIIRSHKTFLFMLNTKEEIDGVSTELLDAVRWSHPADANSIPVTWDEFDASFLAGIAQLGADSGAIVDGLTLRDEFMIYTEKAIHALSQTTDTFVWSRRTVSTYTGLLNKNCIVEVNGVHYLLTNGDVLINDGHSVKSIMTNRIRSLFNAIISSDNYDKSYAVNNPIKNEIWFCIPVGRLPYPRRAFVYNWHDDTWGIKTLIPGIKHAVYASKNRATLTINDLKNMIPRPALSTYKARIGNITNSPFDDTVIGLKSPASFYDMDPASKEYSADEESNPQATVIERTGIPIEGVSSVTTVLSVYPMLTGSPVNIQIGSSYEANSKIYWSKRIEFDPKTERKIDVRSTGELHAYRISSIGGGYFRFFGITFEYSENGAR